MDTNADVIAIAEKVEDIINTRINAERDAAYQRGYADGHAKGKEDASAAVAKPAPKKVNRSPELAKMRADFFAKCLAAANGLEIGQSAVVRMPVGDEYPHSTRSYVSENFSRACGPNVIKTRGGLSEDCAATVIITRVRVNEVKASA